MCTCMCTGGRGREKGERKERERREVGSLGSVCENYGRVTLGEEWRPGEASGRV